MLHIDIGTLRFGTAVEIGGHIRCGCGGVGDRCGSGKEVARLNRIDPGTTKAAEIAHDQRTDVGAGLPQCRYTYRIVILVRIVGIAVARIVDDEAVASVEVGGNAHGQGIADGNVAHHRGEGIVEAAIGEIDRCSPFVLRACGNEVDDAGGRVAAVERALRAAQHLDSLEIEEAHFLRLRTGDVDAVDVECGRRVALLGTVGGRGAADRDLQAVAAHDREVGNGFFELGRIGDAGLGQFVPADCGHGDGGLGQQRFDAVGGDDDIAFDAVLVLRLGDRLILRQSGDGLHRQDCSRTRQ